MKSLRDTFGQYPESETRALLATNAVDVYGFDLAQLAPIAERIGPDLADLRVAA